MGGSEVGVMRSLVLACFVFAAAPAVAQEIHCEGVVEGDAGEVIAGFDLEKDGSIKSRSIYWMPPRDDYEVFGASAMRSPRLILQYREQSSGELVGPSMASVAYTHFEAPDAKNRGPSLSQITITTTLAPARQLSWKASEQSKGEPELAKQLREAMPPQLGVEMFGPDKKRMLKAKFDLTREGDVRGLLSQAKAKGEREVANYKRLIAAGRKLDGCPAL
jgi:hypothetical protein